MVSVLEPSSLMLEILFIWGALQRGQAGITRRPWLGFLKDFLESWVQLFKSLFTSSWALL